MRILLRRPNRCIIVVTILQKTNIKFRKSKIYSNHFDAFKCSTCLCVSQPTLNISLSDVSHFVRFELVFQTSSWSSEHLSMSLLNGETSRLWSHRILDLYINSVNVRNSRIVKWQWIRTFINKCARNGTIFFRIKKTLFFYFDHND